MTATLHIPPDTLARLRLFEEMRGSDNHNGGEGHVSSSSPSRDFGFRTPGRTATGWARTTDKSALDLKRRIVNFLTHKGVTSVGRLNIEVTNGAVTFCGTVASFYVRQLCLSCKHIPGVHSVVDDLKVDERSLGRKTSAS